MNVGFAMCGSFCTYAQVFPIMELLTRDYDVTPIFSQAAYTIDSRFGSAAEHIESAQELCGIAPCTGNTLAKLAHGIADGPVTMAAKSHLRNGRPVLIAVSTNDALGAAAENIGKLMARKHYYFVPYSQDDAKEKPTSMVADFPQIPQALTAALEGRQLQPVMI